MIFHKKVKYLQVFILLLTGLNCLGQSEWKSWNSAQLDLSLTKKLDLRFNHLRGYSISNNFNSEFNQTSVRLDYDFTKRFSISAGAILGSLSLVNGSNRLTFRTTYKTPVADVLNWSNSIQAEIHSSNEKRYRERLIYITTLSTKKRLNFLNLAPSISYSLYYNIGGNSIQYYDKNNFPVVRQTPNGFHRGRLTFNLNSKITKNFSFSLYYLMQREFNLWSDEYHKINVVNPSTGKITRRFNDYNVIGSTLKFDFNLYKKKKSSTKNFNDPNN